MSFPPGKPLLLILLFTIAGGLCLLALGARGPQRPDQTIWVFDASHADTYLKPSGDQAPLVDLYSQQTHRSVQVQLQASRALDARLLSLILSGTQGPQVPDVVEIEIGSVGKYFRAQPAHNGLLPLDDFIARDPLTRQLLPARLATWTSGGQVFGIPRDVHPVSITYRKDLFDAAGVDLAACQWWDQFQQACLKYQQYWSSKGIERQAMQLARWSAADLSIMLQQQHIELIDTQNQLHLTDPRVAFTIAFYARLISGKNAIAADVANSGTLYVQDLADGHSGALFTPDWRIAYLRYQPSLAGKLAMMPLPRFSADDAPTASWGGTMIAIPRNCRDPQQAWELLRFLQLSPQAMQARRSHSTILPAITSEWDNPRWQQPDPLYGNQAISTLYISLARQLPPQHPNPYSLLVSQAIAGVLSSAQGQVPTLSDAHLIDFCSQQLQQTQTQLKQLLDFAQQQETR